MGKSGSFRGEILLSSFGHTPKAMFANQSVLSVNDADILISTIHLLHPIPQPGSELRKDKREMTLFSKHNLPITTETTQLCDQINNTPLRCVTFFVVQKIYMHRKGLRDICLSVFSSFSSHIS